MIGIKPIFERVDASNPIAHLPFVDVGSENGILVGGSVK